MNAGARKVRVSSRSLRVIIPVLALLVASGFWNVRQYRLLERQRLRDQAAQRAEAARAEALRKKNAEWAASDTRLQQLYREIDTLTRMNEQILADPVIKQTGPIKGEGNQEPDDVP